MTTETQTATDAEQVKAVPYVDRDTDDLRAEFDKSARDLNDLLGEAYDATKSNAPINWKQVSDKHKDMDILEVKEKAVRLKRTINDIHDTLDKRFERREYQDALQMTLPEIKESLAAAKPWEKKGLYEAMAERQSQEFYDHYKSRKRYERGDIERFEDIGIHEIMNAVNTTGNTISVNENRDESRVVMYYDPFRVLASYFNRIRPIDGGDTYTYIKELGAGGTGTAKANQVAGANEGAKFADQEYQTQNVSVKVEKLAAFSQVTREQMEDVMTARNFVETRLMRNVEQAVENQIVNGNGTAPNWNGLITQSTSTKAKTAGIKKLDIFLDAIVHLRGTAFVMANLLTMDVATAAIWARLKDDDGRYLWADGVQGFPSRIFGLPLNLSEHMPANTALALDTREYSILDKRGIEIQWGMQADDFVKDIRTVIATCRGNLLAWRANAAYKMTALNTADS